MSQGKYQVEHATRSSRIGVVLIATALVVLALAPNWGDQDRKSVV